MINLDELVFKKLDMSGLQKLVKWAEVEGWNPGKHDAEVFMNTDPNGFYGFFHNDKLIGGGSIVSYDGDFGFMGFFIVDNEYRSKGIGRKLWYLRRNKLIERLKPGATIGMDGVLAMQDFYAKGGFKIAFRDERHENTGSSFNISNNISPINESDYQDILNYDKLYFGFDRKNFIIPWLQLPESKSFKYMLNNRLSGMAIIRKVNKGYKICPLFADSFDIAEELYKACLNSVVGEPVYIDIPVVNKNALKLIRKYNTTYVFECARMYFGKQPDININNVYGITTFELG